MLRTAMVAGACLLAGAAAAADFRAEAYGAAGDGRTDDAPAISKALDACAKDGGGRVLLGPRNYRLDAPITVPSGVTLAGTWEGPHFPPHGTVLFATAGAGKADGPPLISLSSNATLKGVTVFYPDQRLVDGKVTPYPWTIRGAGTNCSVIDVTLVNPVKGIDVGTEPNELHYIRNVFGCPLDEGVYIDRTTDIGRVENVHFNPNFWARSGYPGAPKHDDLIPYLNKHCTSFSLGRSDWEYMTNTFSFGCKVGYRFFQSPAGACNGNFQGIAADWARTAVLVEQSQPPGLLITNGEFVGSPGCEAVVEIAASHTGVVQFSNAAFWGPFERAARIAGKGRVQFTACNFVNWDEGNKGVPAIEATGGAVDVSHSYFMQPKQQAVFGKDVAAVAFESNQFAGPARVVNQSRSNAAPGANQTRSDASRSAAALFGLGALAGAFVLGSRFGPRRAGR
jgi:hypothetical protein